MSKTHYGRHSSVPIAHRVLASSLAAAVMVACSPGIHTPADVKGDIPLTVVNSQPGQAICAMLLVSPKGQPENLLGGDQLKSGAQAQFSVQPGTYKYKSANCDAHESGASMSGTVAEDTIVVKGPTLVSVGGPPASPPAGAAVVVIGTQGRSREVCNAAGSDCTIDNGRSCCPGTTCRDDPKRGSPNRTCQ